MCIGIPMQVVSTAGTQAVCEGRGVTAALDCSLVGPLAAGDWVLSFRGAVMRTMTACEAGQTNGALDALAAVLAGDAPSDAYFADLVGREPTLPPHLRGEG